MTIETHTNFSNLPNLVRVDVSGSKVDDVEVVVATDHGTVALTAREVDLITEEVARFRQLQAEAEKQEREAA